MNNNLSSPHIHSKISINQLMWQVLIALIPGIIASTWIFGASVLVHCLLAIIFAVTAEAIIFILRKRPLHTLKHDGSAIVTGLLFGLTVTPYAPWWITLYGVFFAIIVCKQLYGGLGYNILNPAMAGYVFVLICFPVELNYWAFTADNSQWIQGLITPFTDLNYQTLDALSGATPLSYTKSQVHQMAMLSELTPISLFSMTPGNNWGWINLAFLIGGCWLIIKDVITWHIPLALLITLLLLSMIFHSYDPERYVSGTLTLFTGGTMLAAFFIATDPVTSSTTPYGKIIYAVSIGTLIYIIRTWGNYSDGIAFSILLINVLVPFIDYVTRPAVFGKK